MEKSFAPNEKSKHWSKKNLLQPHQVFKSSGKKYIFDCPDCKHEFESRLSDITDGTFCPYCGNRRLCSDLDCNFCFEKSFAFNEKAINRSKKNKESPTEVFNTSSKKIIFDCPGCEHEYVSQLSAKRGCPYCSHQKLCEDKNCEYCLNNSFASQEKSKYWSKENKISPRQASRGSKIKYKFKCPTCKHTFGKRPNHVNHNSFCPYCTTRRLCDDSDCDFCFKNSFASHKQSKYWSKKNKISPRQVLKFSNEKYQFDCPHCHKIYVPRLADVTDGHWCPCVKNKTEQLLFDFLKKTYNIKISHQKIFDWCKNKNHLPFDFCMEEYNLIIELDGLQHFKQISNWAPVDEIQKRNIYKMKCANQNGYSIIRIFQVDVWEDKNDWQNKLKKAINKIIKTNNPINILIGDIYALHPIYC